MSLQQKLRLAENAIQYTISKMTKGASNKPIDLWHSEVRNKQENPWTYRLRSNDLTDKSVQNQRDQIKPGLNQIANANEKILATADLIETSGIGNCGEQSCVAFKYLWNLRTNPANFVMINLGSNHTCLVIGASPPQVDGWWWITPSPAWPPDAVICDPWYYEWFAVNPDWTRKVRQILAATEPGWNPVQVKVAHIAARVWINNPLYQG